MKKKKLNFYIEVVNKPSPKAVQLFNQQIDIYFKKYIIEKLNAEKEIG